MVKFSGLYTPGSDAINYEDVKFDYPYTLLMYIIRSSIGVK